MAGKNVLTVRVSAELQDRLDAIATPSTGRDRGSSTEHLQIEEITRGLAETDAGEFASDAEVAAIFEKWRRVDGDAD